MSLEHLPRHDQIDDDRCPDGFCSSCSGAFWIRRREALDLEGSVFVQHDRINADGRLHLTTCLPQPKLDALGAA